MKELAGKTAFVTGAASGIGLGIATAFAQAGAKVMLCDIEEAALSAALKQLRLTNVDVDGVKADPPTIFFSQTPATSMLVA